jgi:hypothetical protein
MTVPQYSDTADGVAAIRNLVDSGPIPRVDADGLEAIAETNPPAGTLVYFEPFNAYIQWCGPVQTWKPPWQNPWGRTAHWVGTTSSNHNEVNSNVTGFSSLEWTAYPNRFYRVTVTGRITWNDQGADQGAPDWSVNTKVARALIALREVSDSSIVRRVYDGRASFMFGTDCDIFSTTWLIDGLDGAQEWKLTAAVTSDQTTDDFSISVGDEAATMVLIEDIGPSGAPT